jgi:hypothetical protein
MNRRARILALCLLFPAVALVAPAAADVPDTSLRIDAVTLDPAPATADVPVTVETTVANSRGSASAATIDSVSLAVGGETIATERGFGALSPGENLTAPVTTTFDSAGPREVTITVTGTAADGTELTRSRTRTVVVESGEPTVEITHDSAVERAAAGVSVTVGNPTASRLRNIVVSLGGTGLDTVRDQRVVPALDSGASQTLEFTVRPTVAGEALVEATVRYRTAAGTIAETTRSRALPVAEREETVSVRVAAVDDGGAQSGNAGLGVQVPDGIDLGGVAAQQEPTPEGDVRVTVSNTGNIPVRDVVLDPRAGNESLGPRPVTTTLAPGTEETVTLSLSRVPSAVRFEITYQATGEQSTAVAEFDPLSNRGAVTVTGVNIERRGDTFTITGDVGNPGQGAVSGVVVAVEGGEGVSPAYPGRDFFLGELQGDSFAPFELTATVEQNATAVPVEVSYLVAGEQRTRTVALPVEGVSESSGGGGFPVELAAIVALLVVGALALAIVWRR